MTREEAKKLLPIIQAFSEGKEIEGIYKGIKSPWFKVEDTVFDGGTIFRVKPELLLRPFANAEECWAEMEKHQPFGWVKHKKDGSRSLITSVIGYERKVYFDEDVWYFDRIMEHYTFADGVPFGVKVEE